MATKLYKASLGLNAAVALLLVGAYALRRRLLRLYNKPFRKQMFSFFDSYPVEPGDVVMVGDSITAAAQWSELFPGVAIKNRALSSDMTQDVLSRLDQITDGKPAKIFLLIGTNDLSRGENRADILQRYEQILRKIEQESPRTKVYVQSILPRQRRFRDKIVALNRALESLTNQRGYEFVDLFPWFSTSNGEIRCEFSNDRLHLLGPGYEQWRALIVDKVSDRRAEMH
jgi:lysophospholipase L1-like esterase